MINHPNRNRRAKRGQRPSSTGTVRKPARSSTQHDHDYSALLTSIAQAFTGATLHAPRLFVTDAAGLYEAYLANLPGERQVHTCSACRRFIERFGALVTIGADGALTPVMWDASAAPEFYARAFGMLEERVRSAKVTSVFYCAQEVWGTPLTGEWSHIAVHPTREQIWRRRDLTAGQAMAQVRENVKTVRAALADYSPAVLDEAIRVLQSEQLVHSDKFIGPVRWLRGLHDRPKGRSGEHVLWGAVGTAPEGFCHPRAGVIGTLLEDVRVGLPFEEIRRRFQAKLDPSQYQRPQVAPSLQNIKQAEGLVARLGVAPALERRFATVGEVVACAGSHGASVWIPSPAPAAPAGASQGGVFGHLATKNAETVKPVEIPAATMTWKRFAETMLPSAREVQMLVPTWGRFVAMTTAVNMDAMPILKWDRESGLRNPFGWYVYPKGSEAAQWGLSGNAWCNVEAIVPFPTGWSNMPMPFVADGAIVLLRGACDRHSAGNALFPECLRAELHGVRATIEAYSRTAQLTGRDAPDAACGYDLRKQDASCVLRVFTGGAPLSYRIDRWE